MTTSINLHEIKVLIQQLSLRDKLHLIQWIAPQIERDLPAAAPAQPLPPLRGLWRGTNLTETDIDTLRAEMWADMPREDV